MSRIDHPDPTIILDPGRYVRCRIEWPAYEGWAAVALCRCEGKWEFYQLDSTGLETFLRYAREDEAEILDAKHERERRDLFSKKRYRGVDRIGLRRYIALMTTTQTTELTSFVETVAVYFEVAKKHIGGAAWLCSIRSKMQMDREEFSRLMLAAHQADLVELSRADLVNLAEVRYREESAIDINTTFSFHLLRQIF